MAFFGVKSVGLECHLVPQLADLCIVGKLVQFFDNYGTIVFGTEQIGLVPGTFRFV